MNSILDENTGVASETSSVWRIVHGLRDGHALLFPDGEVLVMIFCGLVMSTAPVSGGTLREFIIVPVWADNPRVCVLVDPHTGLRLLVLYTF